MNEYEFTIYLASDPNLDEADRFYSIFNDGTIATSSGVAYVLFQREAASLEAAIQSAMSDIKKGGGEVVRIEIDSEQMASLPAEKEPTVEAKKVAS